MCILKHANPDLEKVVLKINYVLVILMQSLVKTVLHKGVSERNLEGVFQEVASQDNFLQNHTVASQSI